jgi:hypothetical protein
MTSKLNLDPSAVLLARELARRAGEPVTQLALTHTTVSIERAVLRLGGLDRADPGGMPWVNRLTDAVRASVGLEHGVALPVWDALRAGGYPDLRTLAEAAAAGKAGFRIPLGREAVAARELAVRSISAGVSAPLANIRYVRAAAGRLGMSFAPDSFVVERAHQVLDEAVSLLRRISTEGLLNTIADGTFGVASRPPGGGHGLAGVITRAEGYFNPVTEILDGTDDGAPGAAVAELIGGN